MFQNLLSKAACSFLHFVLCVTESSSYNASYGQPPSHSAYVAQQAPSQAAPPAQQYQPTGGQSGAGLGPGKYATSTAPAPSQSAFSTYPPLSSGYSVYSQQVQGKPQPLQSMAADQFAGYPRQTPLPRRPQPQSGMSNIWCDILPFFLCLPVNYRLSFQIYYARK